ncbi:MAG: cupin domain-containing protein [Oscillospiraceae bacterium]
MSHKFTPVDGYTTYEGKGHYSCLTTRLHNADEVNDGHTTMGLTHFLPGGGSHMAPAPCELIYYCVSGEVTISFGDGTKVVMHDGDSVHMGPGTDRQIDNTGYVTTKMLVTMTK